MHDKFSVDLAVRKLCRRKKLSIKGFSQRLGKSYWCVRNTLKRDSTTVATCEEYANALGVTLPELISEGYIEKPW
ncbi:helix-turn-helix transcriptional regulator [Paramixta manurensis]|uniref:Helix-turn-helix transcriptional regulator n=1 Tax=Paramixta manurensis TaxID=2740817 RepID=A0A6M8U9V7_9GAMM|nr:helix-turn-helix transcriptional regulator [Erwiniaceae bacterium PD-1]